MDQLLLWLSKSKMNHTYNNLFEKKGEYYTIKDTNVSFIVGTIIGLILSFVVYQGLRCGFESLKYINDNK